ncbi:CsgG/HfaB family protein [Aestuariispira ectoiniformans]|uniref:CsgG/HfaB family protein n=1 Tax=Aestuariispira ectoiniformans TaxID=2775080 RepID=UPI00223B6677|nr:CsgG/HfaB family protein [Aestuariispira ectoiniformans]
MYKSYRNALALAGVVVLSACAVPDKPVPKAEAPATQAEQETAQEATLLPDTKRLKRKVAIARFTNETRYGKTFLRNKSDDPLGKQATDMLTADLVKSGQFMVFERPDIEKIKSEQAYLKAEQNLIGVDTLVVGSVTEFGRHTTGKTGFFSSTKKQLARATVEIRLVDTRTGHAFFSAEGHGEASSEAGNVAGFGNRAEYDGTVNDRAIGAAVSDVVSSLISKLDERPWRTDILKIEGDKMYISGGKFQGLKVGDRLNVMKAGETIRSEQTGFDIELPATKVGTIEILAHFGNTEDDEGSIAVIQQNNFAALPVKSLFIEEGDAS